jgi:cytochrome c peroxidase
MMCMVVLVVACGETTTSEPDLGPPPAPTSSSAEPALNPRLVRRFRPLRQPAGLDAAQVELGKTLFFDPRLSKHENTSCSSCHPLDRAGADARPTSIGTDGNPGRRNAPPIVNAARLVAQFWDGRASNLEEQAKSPLTNPDEMGMTEGEVLARLRELGYAPIFERAFPGAPMDMAHVARALAAFERTLVLPGRWDRYLEGERDALTAREIQGMKLFADIGCVQCHTGELVGGSMFQKVGVSEPWPNQKDLGRYEVTHQDADRMVFKVPSLRNITMTAPYFHDGSATTLQDAIRQMARYQLGTELTRSETASIIAWFGSLTSDIPRIDPPTLP